MKLIVGLGNPGPQYTKTRHNAGFMVVDHLCALHARSEPVKARFHGASVEATLGASAASGFASTKCLFLKPTTFMNLSGQAVAEAARFFKLNIAADVLVIVDDLYLPTGKCKLLSSGGTGGHNGLESIQQALATQTYPRLRVGVGLQPSGGKPPLMDQADFVLGRFTEDEEPLLTSAIALAAKGVETWATQSISKAMNLVNAEPKPPPTKPPTSSPPQTRPTPPDQP